MKDKNDTDTIREVQLLLEELLQNKQNGIEFILHDEDAKECGDAIVYLCWKHEKGIISLKTIQEIL